MAFEQDFRSALITGASSGIGASLALRLAGADRTLVLVGRDRGRLEGIAEKCRLKGSVVEVLQQDVTDADAMRVALEAADDRHAFDVILASAGVAFGRESAEQARQTVETNILGVLNTLAPLESRLITRGKGQIGLLSSLAAFRVLGGPGAYAGSKAWVRLYGEALRGRLAGKGVGVSVICPGFVDTPMIDPATRDKLPEAPVPADEAADLIVRGLERNAPRIVMPWRAALQIWWLSTLPTWISDRKTMKRFMAARNKQG